MSASIPVTTSIGGGDTRPHEPSMEEILASIRRIIADDQSLPGRSEDKPELLRATDTASPSVPGTGEAELPEEELAQEPEETAMMAQGTVAAPQFAGPDGPINEPVTSQHVGVPNGAMPTTGESMLDHNHGAPADPDDRVQPRSIEQPTALISTATNSAVSSAFNVLAASRLADNSTELLGMTREMIRPLLQGWLDDNLPALVERLVRDEIERVARGGR